VETAQGKSEGGGFSASDLTGDQADGTQAHGVIKAIGNREDLEGLEDLINAEVSAKRLVGEGEEMEVGGFHRSSSPSLKESLPEGMPGLPLLSSTRPVRLFRRTLQLTWRSRGVRKPWVWPSSWTSTREGSSSWKSRVTCFPIRGTGAS